MWPSHASRGHGRFVLLTALLVCAWVPASPSLAESPPEQTQSLDERVQSIKSEVLEIAAELSQLEEKLLFPSNTQVAVFVSLPAGEADSLDSVEIRIDGEPVTRHVYSFKELQALERGGVQKIYVGNLATGGHQLEVAVSGQEPGGDTFTESNAVEFRKEPEPTLLNVTLASNGTSGFEIGFGDE